MDATDQTNEIDAANTKTSSARATDCWPERPTHSDTAPSGERTQFNRKRTVFNRKSKPLNRKYRKRDPCNFAKFRSFSEFFLTASFH